MNFREITFNDYPGLTAFFKNQPYRLCVYSLPSLIAWRTEEYQPCGAIVDDMLVIGSQFVSRKENRHLILPISLNGTPKPEKLCDLADRFHFSQYWFVPEDYIHTFGKDRLQSLFSIAEQEAYHDYIYLTHDLAALQGNKYSKKRNLIHQFERNYVDQGRVTVAPMTSDDTRDCIEFLDRWCEQRSCDLKDDFDLACERAAAANIIENLEKTDATGLFVRVDGAVSAFGIGCRLTDEMGVLHFQKAFSHIKGLYQYFDNLCAQRLFKGYRYINKESDMNVPGLAKAKKSYHPAMMVRSYVLKLK